MKVFNIENNQLVVYVQIKDLILSTITKDGTPKSIHSIVEEKYSNIPVSDLDKFVRFDDCFIVDYFNGAIWCLDPTKLFNKGLLETVQEFYILYDETLAGTLSNYYIDEVFKKDEKLNKSRFNFIPNLYTKCEGVSCTGYLSVNEQSIIIIFNNNGILEDNDLLIKEIDAMLDMMNIDCPLGYIHTTVSSEGKVIVTPYKAKDYQRKKRKVNK